MRQTAAVIALCKGIMIRRDIPKHRILGHSDVAPGRKKDPGEKFPWRLLADSGVGLWVEPAPIVRGVQTMLGQSGDDVLALQKLLASFGYGVPLNGLYDAATMDVVAAFQRHFRPERIDGIADTSTLTTLNDLARADAERGARELSGRASPIPKDGADRDAATVRDWWIRAPACKRHALRRRVSAAVTGPREPRATDHSRRVAACGKCIDQRQRLGRSIDHRDGCGMVERDDRRRRDPHQNFIKSCNLRPVRRRKT